MAVPLWPAIRWARDATADRSSVILIFFVCPQSLHVNLGVVTLLGHDYCDPNRLPSLCFLKLNVLNSFSVVSTNELLININALLFIMGGGGERAYFL